MTNHVRLYVNPPEKSKQFYNWMINTSYIDNHQSLPSYMCLKGISAKPTETFDHAGSFTIILAFSEPPYFKQVIELTNGERKNRWLNVIPEEPYVV